MLVILEGNECNYKTTVANKLREKLNIPVVKGSTFESAQCSNEELYEHYFKLTHLDNVILDRFLYSNLVYASLYKDYSILNEQQVKRLEKTIEHRAVVVYLYAGTETIIGRIEDRGDDYVKKDMVAKINEKYKEVIYKCELPTLKLNTFDLSSDEIVKKVVRILNDILNNSK